MKVAKIVEFPSTSTPPSILYEHCTWSNQEPYSATVWLTEPLASAVHWPGAQDAGILLGVQISPVLPFRMRSHSITQPPLWLYFLPTCLYTWGSCNKNAVNWMAYKQQTFISHSSGRGSLWSRHWQVWYLGKTRLSWLIDGSFYVSSSVRRGRELPVASCVRH
jgi:hypothetical protein